MSLFLHPQPKVVPTYWFWVESAKSPGVSHKTETKESKAKSRAEQGRAGSKRR